MIFSLAQLPVEELRIQLGNGVTLMILGMAIVFVFLSILVFTTKGVSKIVKGIEAKAPKATPVAPSAVSSAPASDAEVAAAIVAAVVKSRN